MAYQILVDYDNLTKPDKQRGLIYIAEKIVNLLNPSEVSELNILLRLYGGWYENNVLTRLAQRLAIERNGSFPATMLLSDQQTQCIVNVELAFSLMAQPATQLFNTLRIRGIPHGLACLHPNQKNCRSNTCPVVSVFDFINQDECGECQSIVPSDLLYKTEQKLIDTMLTSDLIYSGHISNNVSIVSSDDDFWPGILTALNLGIKIIHFHTRPHPRHIIYSRLTTRNYLQRQL